MKQPNITVHDIAKATKWRDVKRAIKYHYPTDKNDYEPVFNTLVQMDVVKVKPNEFIEVYCGLITFNVTTKKLVYDLEVYRREEGKQYYGIHIKHKGEKTNYSMSFMPWAEVASMPVLKSTLDGYTMEDILAHFIWEITFYGTEKEMNKAADRVRKLSKEAAKKMK